jgi:membrane protein YdbS with pleckstrin-like domain
MTGDPQTEEAAQAQPQTLDPGLVPQQRLVGRLSALAVSALSLIGVTIALLVADDLGGAGRAGLVAIWLAVMTGLQWLAHMWPARVFAHTRYTLDADGLQISRGVYWRETTYVPRSRVQHTDVSQGPVERRYGLGTLVVYTAGTAHARVALQGLAYDTALALRDALRLDRPDDTV